MVRSKGFEPLTFWFVAKHSIQLSYERMDNNKLKWWLRMESNHRHKDFQSSALPTELQSHIWRFRRGLNPRSSAWQADVLTTALRNHIGCGGRTRTYDLWVMSPTSYQLLPLRDIYKIWRRKRDSNPCADCSTSRFSRPVPSTRLGYSSTIGA